VQGYLSIETLNRRTSATPGDSRRLEHLFANGTALRADEMIIWQNVVRNLALFKGYFEPLERSSRADITPSFSLSFPSSLNEP